MDLMRIALVSPYSWTYPGGVTRHIEALAEQFIADGHHVRVLAPYDPPDTLAAVLHRGARPQTARRRPTTWSRSAVPSASRPTARSPICRSPPCGVAAPAPRAAHRRLRRRPHPRAGRAAGRLGGDRLDPPAAGRHLPLLLGEPGLQRDRQPDRRPPGAQPPARPDRRLRGRGLDRAALLRRPLPGDPQRRARRSRARSSAGRRPGRPRTGCGSCSSARRSSARACRCCCAPSRPCASTSRPS